jgi:predicted O-methyltransferase YrrM
VLDAAATFTDALPALDGVEGWLTEDQAHRLWDRASELQPGAQAVEIGSFRGRSTVITALGLPAEATLVAIDPHAGNDRGPQEWEGKEAEAETDHAVFLANLERAGVRDRVTYVRKFSDAAMGDVQGDIDLLYIDGAHRYAPARDDIVTWGARVVPGGTMLIHDSFSSIGVTLAILATLATSGEWEYVGRSGSMAEYRKVRLTAAQRRRSATAQAAQLPWFASNVVMKVLIQARLRPVARALGFPDDKPWPF